MTDKERVASAFKALRRLGYTARQNFMCCGGCAMAEFAGEAEQGKDRSKFVTYNKQGNEAFNNYGELTGSLWLHWDGSAEDIVRELELAGLAVAPHDGNKELSVEIFGFRPAHERLANRLIRFMNGQMPKFGAFDGEDFEGLPQVLALALRRAGVKENWRE